MRASTRRTPRSAIGGAAARRAVADRLLVPLDRVLELFLRAGEALLLEVGVLQIAAAALDVLALSRAASPSSAYSRGPAA